MCTGKYFASGAISSVPPIRYLQMGSKSESPLTELGCAGAERGETQEDGPCFSNKLSEADVAPAVGVSLQALEGQEHSHGPSPIHYVAPAPGPGPVRSRPSIT